MWRATKAGLLAHKLRLVLTALAVAAGVGFVCGTLVLTDTLGKTFSNLFEEVSANKSVIVTGVSPVDDAGPDGSGTRPLPDSTIAKVRAVPGVKDARGDVFSFAQLVAPDGKPVASAPGAPTFGTSHQDGPLSSTGIASGRAPKGPNEVAIDKTTATRLELAPGAKVKIVTITGVREYTLSGIMTFGERDNLVGATLVSWDLPTAQQVLGRPGQVDEVDVLANGDVSDEALRDRIAAALGPDHKVQTGKEAAEEQANGFKEALNFINYIIGGFAVISLLVGSFIIVNTFSILVAQRTRELALLRALGAARRQVLGSVLTEAAITGVVGSLVGVVAGIALAVMLQWLFSQLGADLPSGLPVVALRTVAVGLVVGLVVTTAAAIVPALKASQVAPVAAMAGDVALRPPSTARTLVLALVVRVAVIAAGVGVFVLGIVWKGLLLPVGALVVFVGVVLIVSLVAAPLVGLIGEPVARLGVVGRLGQLNAVRNPRRTASTAAALMIGLALVTGAATLASSANKSVGKLVDGAIKADYVLQGTGFFGLSPALADSLRGRPAVDAVTALGATRGKVGDSRRSFTAVTAGGTDLINVEIVEGSAGALAGPDGLLVQEDEADSRNLRVGDTMVVEFRSESRTLKVGGIYKRHQMIGSYLIPEATYRAVDPDPLHFAVVVRATKGQVPAAGRSLRDALREFPAAEVRTREEFIADQKSQTNQILIFIVVLLVLSVLIAVLGVINTLALSVYERVREVGLLRAVGTRKGQLAAVVFVESVLVCVIGGILGLALGTVIGGSAVRALQSQGLTELAFPVPTLIFGLFFSIVAGAVAAVWPAFRSTRLNILESIAVE